ncbi:MAG: bifunctional lysylphosphatidylglycerol flippase/synthetase MprF [Thermodesulfobacteriota bacterium]
MRYLGPLVGLCLFLCALWVLDRELRNYREILAQLRMVGSDRIGLAVLFTVLSYSVLTFYDSLAFRYIRRPMAYHKIAFGSFLGYVFSHNIGLSVVGASAVRFRIYSNWGVTPLEIGKIVVFCTMTFWLGFGIVGSFVFLIRPIEIPQVLQPYLNVSHAWPLGVVLAGLTCLYLALVTLRRKPFQLGAWQIEVPSGRITLAQIGLTLLDWLFFANVLYVLLPPGHGLPFSTFMCVFLLAEAAALISHVPGGIGVLDAVILFLLRPMLEPALHAHAASAITASLVVYRCIYYLIPLILGTALLGVNELLERRVAIRRGEAAWGWLATADILAAGTFISGAVLLMSGVIPYLDFEKVHHLRALLGRPLTETAHFFASLVGVSLLVTARGLQRRLASAYLWASVLLGVGIVLSLMRSFDYEEAGVLAVTLLSLLPSRRHFYRSAPMTGQWFTPGWVTAILLVLVASVWVGVFSFGIPFDSPEEVWRQFTLFVQAGGRGRQLGIARFWRAVVGAGALVGFIAVWRMSHHRPLKPHLPSPRDLEQARRVISRVPETYANLALLGDKTLLWSRSGESFLMYTARDRIWVALGDPVGEEAEKVELAWHFREMSERSSASSVFYAATDRYLPLYLDQGMGTFKLGEQAMVDLRKFDLRDPSRREMSEALTAAGEAGFSFQVLAAGHAQAAFPQLRAISDAWLSHHRAKESAFARGFFDEAYLRYFPIAAVSQQGRIIAFANLWSGGGKTALAADLVRQVPGSPPGLLDYLFIQVMLWGASEGYRQFDLGMAPLLGLEKDSPAHIWSEIGRYGFRLSKHFADFQALRRYKEKFDPLWVPRYVVCPGGLPLRRALTIVARIIYSGLDQEDQQ